MLYMCTFQKNKSLVTLSDNKQIIFNTDMGKMLMSSSKVFSAVFLYCANHIEVQFSCANTKQLRGSRPWYCIA